MLTIESIIFLLDITYLIKKYEPMAGFEPATFGLEVRHAIQLRYTGILLSTDAIMTPSN